MYSEAAVNQFFYRFPCKYSDMGNVPNALA